MSRLRRMIATVLLSMLLVAGAAMPAAAQETDQDGLVNVSIGDVTILEEVDISLAAVVVANVCANLDLNAAVLAAQEVDETGQEFVCEQRGSGRAVAITDN